MRVEHETANYAWYYASLYGVGRFMRKSDGALTPMETGSECEELRASIDKLMLGEVDTGPHTKESVFDSIADQYDYSEED